MVCYFRQPSPDIDSTEMTGRCFENVDRFVGVLDIGRAMRGGVRHTLPSSKLTSVSRSSPGFGWLVAVLAPACFKKFCPSFCFLCCGVFTTTPSAPPSPRSIWVDNIPITFVRAERLRQLRGSSNASHGISEEGNPGAENEALVSACCGAFGWLWERYSSTSGQSIGTFQLRPIGA
jgi:hypothetical protein